MERSPERRARPRCDESGDGPDGLVWLFAPLGRDAGLLGDALVGHGFTVRTVADARALAEALEREADAGVLVLTQEALSGAAMRAIGARLASQPPWAELPIVLLVDASGHTVRELTRFQRALPGSRALVLQRPVRLSELGSAVDAMCQSRRRQHALRDYIERQDMLRRELNHRVKNTLASVQALHALTAAGASDLDGFNDSFEGRLEAMAGVHQVLHDNDYVASELAAVVDVVLGPYRGDGHVEIDGVRTPLGAEVAQGLGLVVHELATNASKHGALSGPAGRVHLSWGCADGRFEACWVERGGPSVTAPTRTGYGTRFIEATMLGYGGTATFDHTAGGTRVTLVAPARNVLADAGRGSAA